MTKKKASTALPATEKRTNNWDNGGFSMLAGIFGGGQGIGQGTDPLSQTFNLSYSNAYTPLTLNRILLNYAYMTHGVIQTMIDQPVEDGMRGGLDIQVDDASPEDLDDFQDYLNQTGVLERVKDALKWAKLFGGAGLIINTAQDPESEFNIDAINQDTPLRFIDADRWELTYGYGDGFDYYGQKIDPSRVIRLEGKRAPSFIRARLQGWEMSELERVIRDINSYVKNQDVIYELLDEAKIDVWKIEGFNTNILSSANQAKMNQRLQIATLLKNYHSAIIMDKEDEYEQKTMTFSGLADMMNQVRIGAAASVRMPMTKLFGLSASGFNAGEDDIENYNSMVEGEVRAKARRVLSQILPICWKQKFGYVPDHLHFEFKPLRVLGAKDEEEVKTSKQNRYAQQYSLGLLTDQEMAKILKQENLCPIETDVLSGEAAKPPISAQDIAGDAQADDDEAEE